MPATSAKLGRRRFLAVSAAAACLAGRPAAAAVPLVRWQGQALGGLAWITLVHPDRGAAERLLAVCAAEIRRLEAIFSLYRPDSALSRLNAAGRLEAPPLELVELLARSAAFSELTEGAFDPTVQPLFRRYAEHFAAAGANPAGPEIADLLPLVDWRGVEVQPGRVAFARPGMAVTLNGITQGFITDRVAAILRGAGMADVLVDLGELRALGRHPDGRPWRAAVRTGARAEPGPTFELADRALAVSAPAGSPFEPSARLNHLLDPATGRCGDPTRTVAVLAPDATTADALSTAFALLPAERARAIAASLPGVEVFRWS